MLGYYVDHSHEVVDKHERAPGVVNVDIIDFEPDGRYDAVITVSTLEHVGFDEADAGRGFDGEVGDADKSVRALERMASWLRPGGSLLVTVPLGYNPALDERLRSGALRFDELRFMRRTSADNRWREAAAEEVRGCATTRRISAPMPSPSVFAAASRTGRSACPSGRLRVLGNHAPRRAFLRDTHSMCASRACSAECARIGSGVCSLDQ